MSELTVTDRTRLRRLSERGHFDRETIYSIIDASPQCTVAYLRDGKPAILPTLQWREGDQVFWHGSTGASSNMLSADNPVCMNIAIFDGLVLARSAFHHSANFRSVTIFGQARAVTDHEEKREKLKTFVDSLYPGRWESLRPVKDKEIRATRILSLAITEASAKIRSGQPVDDEADYDTAVWAGVLPLRHGYGEPEADPRNLDGLDVPDYLPR